jgi:hypothetical protein
MGLDARVPRFFGIRFAKKMDCPVEPSHDDPGWPG